MKKTLQEGAHASRVAVIINASSQLGRAMTMELAMQGFSLALCTPHPADIEDTVEEAFNAVEVSPFKVSAYECDARDPNSVGICAREIFEDFSRVDVLCLIENRADEFIGTEEDDSEAFYADCALPVLGESGKVFKTLNVSIADIRSLLDHFYPLLKAPKPEAPPLKFFDNIPTGARRVRVQANSMEDDEEEDEIDVFAERASTSLVLYLTTPDTMFTRAGKSRTCSRVRAIEAVMQGLNAEAVFRDEPVRACTAVIGTLDGETPFWRFDKERFLYESKQAEVRMAHEKDRKPTANKESTPKSVSFREPKVTTVDRKDNRSPTYEAMHSMIPKRFLRSRRASRSRGDKKTEPSSHASVVEIDEDDDGDGEDDRESFIDQDSEARTLKSMTIVEDEELSRVNSRVSSSAAPKNDQQQTDDFHDDDDDDYIPPPSPVHKSVYMPEKLTAESLTHREACAWVTWGLSRGRTRILVGYDVLLLRSAWVSNAFLNRLFSFNPRASRNLLPIRDRDSYLPTSETVKRAFAKYDAERRRRQRVRELVVMIAVVFAIFPPAGALLCLAVVFIWQLIVTSNEGHRATERAVAMVLFIVSIRRRWFIRGAWDKFRSAERTLFGTISRSAADMQHKWDDIWRKGKRHTSTMSTWGGLKKA